MFGAIIGDTVGSAYEFHNTKEYDFTLFLGNSAYTDDSIMTIADRVARPFPKIFHKILDAVREETVYGKTCKIVE